jgi:chromosome segregation ATPase
MTIPDPPGRLTPEARLTDEVLDKAWQAMITDTAAMPDGLSNYPAKRAVLLSALAPVEEEIERLNQQIAVRDRILHDERQEKYALETKLFEAQQEIERLRQERDEARREASVNKIAFDSANHLAAQAEAERDQLKELLRKYDDTAV